MLRVCVPTTRVPMALLELLACRGWLAFCLILRGDVFMDKCIPHPTYPNPQESLKAFLEISQDIH